MVCLGNRTGIAPEAVARSRSDGVGPESSRRKPSWDDPTIPGPTGPARLEDLPVWNAFCFS